MGSKERRIAHKENLKKQIITAAQTIFKEEGSWQTVTIRKIAAAIDYSLPTIYEFFENKDTLLTALQQEAYISLGDKLTTNLRTTSDDSRVVLSTVAQTYWDFSQAQPELYQIMHSGKNPLSENKETITFIRNTVRQALQNIKSNKKLVLSPQKLEDKIDCMRGIMHGFIMLSLTHGMEQK